MQRDEGRNDGLAEGRSNNLLFSHLRSFPLFLRSLMYNRLSLTLSSLQPVIDQLWKTVKKLKTVICKCYRYTFYSQQSKTKRI